MIPRNHEDSTDQPSNRTTPSTRTTRTTRTAQDRAPSRIVPLALALMLATVFLGPTAAAETAEKYVCIGDSGAADTLEAYGPGCARGWIDTPYNCSGSGEDYSCILWIEIGVDLFGTQTCGNISSPSLTASWQTPTTCTTLPDDTNIDEGDLRASDDAGTWREYSNDKLRTQGLTITIDATVCAWADRTADVQTYCEDFSGTVYLPPDRTQGGNPVERVLDEADGRIQYVQETAENTQPPIGLNP